VSLAKVVSLILSGGTTVRIQATPLSGTTIKVGRRPRAGKTSRTVRLGRRHRPSMSLFRRLSSRKAGDQITAGVQLGFSQMGVSPSAASTQTGVRSLSTGADVHSARATQLSSDSDSSPATSEPNSPSTRPSTLHGLKNSTTVLSRPAQGHRRSVQGHRLSLQRLLLLEN